MSHFSFKEFSLVVDVSVLWWSWGTLLFFFVSVASCGRNHPPGSTCSSNERQVSPVGVGLPLRGGGGVNTSMPQLQGDRSV